MKFQNIHPMLTVALEMIHNNTNLYDYAFQFGKEDTMTYRFDNENPYEWWLKEEVFKVANAYGCEVWYDVEEHYEDDDDEEPYVLYVCYVGVPL